MWRHERKRGCGRVGDATLGSWLEEQTVPLLEWAFVMLLLEEQAVPLLEWAFVMLLLEEQAVPLLEWAVGR